MDDGRFKKVVIITAKDNYFSAYSCNFYFYLKSCLPHLI